MCTLEVRHRDSGITHWCAFRRRHLDDICLFSVALPDTLRLTSDHRDTG